MIQRLRQWNEVRKLNVLKRQAEPECLPWVQQFKDSMVRYRVSGLTPEHSAVKAALEIRCSAEGQQARIRNTYKEAR